MKLYEKYFIEQKWMKLLRQGKLGKDALRRIQKSGLAKSARKWTTGVNTGAENIAKKKGTTIARDLFRPEDIRRGEYYHIPKDKIHLKSNVTTKSRLDDILAKRHEADEASLIKKHTNKYQRPSWSMKGKHASNEVLRRERELTRVGQSLYGKSKMNPKASSLLKFRKGSGEYKNIGTKKGIKKIDRMLASGSIKNVFKKEFDQIKNLEKKQSLAAELGDRRKQAAYDRWEDKFESATDAQKQISSRILRTYYDRVNATTHNLVVKYDNDIMKIKQGMTKKRDMILNK